MQISKNRENFDFLKFISNERKERPFSLASHTSRQFCSVSNEFPLPSIEIRTNKKKNEISSTYCSQCIDMDDNIDQLDCSTNEKFVDHNCHDSLEDYKEI